MGWVPTRRQWRRWTLASKSGYVGTWLGACGLAITIILTVASLLNPLDRFTSRSAKDLEFEQLLYQADEQVKKPFEKFVNSVPPPPHNCDLLGQISSQALDIAEKIDAFDTKELASFRETKALAQHEYLTMLYSWAAGIGETCREQSRDGDARVIFLARKALAEFEIVRDLRRNLYAASNLPRLREIAKDIENVTSWYAGRAACILYLRGQCDLENASNLAQLAHDRFPDEPDKWMDQVRSIYSQQTRAGRTR
jgi:hypothetical protein